MRLSPLTYLSIAVPTHQTIIDTFWSWIRTSFQETDYYIIGKLSTTYVIYSGKKCNMPQTKTFHRMCVSLCICCKKCDLTFKYTLILCNRRLEDTEKLLRQIVTGPEINVGVDIFLIEICFNYLTVLASKTNEISHNISIMRNV